MSCAEVAANFPPLSIAVPANKVEMSWRDPSAGTTRLTFAPVKSLASWNVTVGGAVACGAGAGAAKAVAARAVMAKMKDFMLMLMLVLMFWWLLKIVCV